MLTVLGYIIEQKTKIINQNKNFNQLNHLLITKMFFKWSFNAFPRIKVSLQTLNINKLTFKIGNKKLKNAYCYFHYILKNPKIIVFQPKILFEI